MSNDNDDDGCCDSKSKAQQINSPNNTHVSAHTFLKSYLVCARSVWNIVHASALGVVCKRKINTFYTPYVWWQTDTNTAAITKCRTVSTLFAFQGIYFRNEVAAAAERVFTVCSHTAPAFSVGWITFWWPISFLCCFFCSSKQIFFSFFWNK